MRLSSIVFSLFLFVPLSGFTATGKTPQRTPNVMKVASEDQMPAITILSIIPAQGEPGATVTLNGTGFTTKTAAYLGSISMATKVVSSKILTFEIPELPPGLYALYLKRDDGATSKSFNFVLQAQKPVVVGLSPDTIYNCAAGREREVIISGRNFHEGCQVLLDGAVIKSSFISKESITISVPSLLTSGLHQIQVKNPPDEVSGALALFINSRPEVSNVIQGSDFVSYYELVIEGRNFLQGSALVVDGSRLSSGAASPGERERVVYVNCNRLIYQRHPYDSSPKNLTLQVVNQNGEESPIVSVTAP